MRYGKLHFSTHALTSTACSAIKFPLSLSQRYSVQGINARTYRCGQSRFLEFCLRLDISPDVLSEETICRFVAYLEQDRLAYGTIKCYLSAFCHLQISRGQGDLFSSRLPRLDYVLLGVKRLQGSRQTRPLLPITPEILRALHRDWSPRASQFDIVMLWAACCTGFFGFLRAE